MGEANNSLKRVQTKPRFQYAERKNYRPSQQSLLLFTVFSINRWAIARRFCYATKIT